MFLRAEPIIRNNASPTFITVEGYFSMNVSISIKIVDTDFEETVNKVHICDAIIDVYERRNLNVVRALVMSLIKSESVFVNISEMFGNYKKQKKFAKYADDVEKYLMLV